MIKFFRTFRQRMIQENRFSRYLLYAIGEIVLVVIGILIALQINNWNTIRKEAIVERQVLAELVKNLRMDSADHAGNHQWSLDIAAHARYVVDELEARRPWHDSMAVHYGWLMPHGLATLNTTAFENLKSIGFNLIRNDSVRMALTHYYTVDVARMLTVEREFGAESLVHHITPAVLKHLRINRPWGDSTPRDHAALMDDLEFQTVVRWKSVAMDHLAGEYGVAQKRASALIVLIERELANSNR